VRCGFQGWILGFGSLRHLAWNVGTWGLNLPPQLFAQVPVPRRIEQLERHFVGLKQIFLRFRVFSL
jgi:hypothetical protein